MRFKRYLGAVVAVMLLLFAASAVNAADDVPGIRQIRKQFVNAITSTDVTNTLFNNLNAIDNKPPLILAYIGALDALKAKHTWNPYNKIRFLNYSEKTISDAVVLDPHNIEIRFMRFSIEHNVPGFLGYGKNLNDDREEMIRQLNHKNYGTADRELTINIIKFLLDSKRCTPKENSQLSQQLASI